MSPKIKIVSKYYSAKLKKTTGIKRCPIQTINKNFLFIDSEVQKDTRI